MKKVLISDKFYKTVPRDKVGKIKNLCKKLQIQLNESNQGIFGTTIGNQTLKFQGQDHLYKFRVGDGDRVIFTYTKYLPIETRNEYADGQGIYLIEYVNHDEQSRIARNYDNNFERGASKNLTDDSAIEEEALIDYVDEQEYRDYNKYLDLNNAFIYLADEYEIESFLNKSDEVFDVLINDQQYELVEDLNPLLLMGGAGSGKTLVSLHKLNSYNKQGGKGAYFTYSDRLKIKSEHLFKKISSVNMQVTFDTLKDFCLKTLSLREGQFVDLPWFKKNYDEIKTGVRVPPTLNAIDVWTEIRGILKGYMWDGWARNYPLSFMEIQEISRKTLEEKYEYIRFDASTRSISCQDTSRKRYKEVVNFVRSDPELLPEKKETVLNDAEKISRWVLDFDYRMINGTLDKRILPLDEYKKLSSEVSRYTDEEKQVIHDICLHYQELLDGEKLFDDNDLAGYCLLKPEALNKFDYLVVDEVQDLTELQIYLLFQLSTNKKHIMWTGDIHQIINPTYFDLGRLRKLLYLNNIRYKEHFLNKNYRSQQYVVELANKLRKIRGSYIAQTNQYTEELEQAIYDGEKVYLLDNSHDLLKNMIVNINEKANAATVVSDEEDKNYLEKLLGKQGNNIYTIAEIKGLEFDYIFCYNLLGKHEDYWKDIFGNLARRNSKYRYYFNIFYVAITRARRYLCIFDQSDLPELQQELFSMFDQVKSFDGERLSLTHEDRDPAAWYNRGRVLEKEESYDMAIIAYRRGNAEEVVIERCKARKLAKEKNYQEAISILLNIEEYKLAYDYARDSGIDALIILTSLISSRSKKIRELENEYGQEQLISIAASNLSNIVYGNKIQNNYIDSFIMNDMDNSIDTINKTLNRILEVSQ